ncbi:HAD family hydrolase [Xylanimonas protaetiae]|uniref:HAD-IB family hydrolase n=1 Tax=Xylanimonas protaetiae TaxID=2509457 RepID=A0A4P6EZ36_9MICO|nr:HAD-IB family hydrolase [Xylanimonas protaetiae]QAY68710.1 HAD-IB family hydrolase [Xylanimonas protaetiae]
MPASPAVAFVDVDDTLVQANTMALFLRHYLRERGREHELADRVAHLLALDAVDPTRTRTNREYHRQFAGEGYAGLRALGRDWLHAALPGLVRASVVAELDAVRRGGGRVVLLSGSCEVVVEPLGEAVGADRVECTRLVVADGTVTGEVEVPVVDTVKVDRAAALLDAWGVAASDAVAYGDHPSDLPLLALVGAGVVVGPDPRMADEAGARGWRTLP